MSGPPSAVAAADDGRKLRMRCRDLAALPAPAIAVRRAGADDADALAAILASAFADARWTPELARRLLLEATDVIAVWLAPAEGVPGATASVRLLPERFPTSGYLHWVGTQAQHQGRGLGRAVSLAALQAMRRRGCADAVLETDDQRRSAIGLYAALGFVPEPCHPTHAARWSLILPGWRP